VARPISPVNAAWTWLQLLWRQGLRWGAQGAARVRQAGAQGATRLREASAAAAQPFATPKVAKVAKVAKGTHQPAPGATAAEPDGKAAPNRQHPQPSPRLHAPLRACASVVIPALNEAQRIASVVQHALADAATAEVIVIDDSSIDDTAALARAAGATVYTSSMLGKGASMQDGVGVVNCELVVFLDGDLAGLRSGIITDLCRPLVRGEADFVKARFGRSGGRVTELTAKPMLKVFFPELAHFKQPLGGIIAARTSLLKALSFEDAYGVDVGLLIDAHRAGARLAEVDIGSLENDSQPLHDLTVMANEVARVIYSRARAAGRLHVEQIVAMYETQRQATATMDHVLSRRRGRHKLLLLDMDGAVTPTPFVAELARATGHEAALQSLWAGSKTTRVSDEPDLAARTAALFKFIHRQQFERVAHGLEIRPGLIAFVNRMRRAGYMVGVVSTGYFVAAEILRRRVFADFALANTIQFDGDVCNGELRLNPAFSPSSASGPSDDKVDPAGSAGPASPAGPAHSLCHVVQQFREDRPPPKVSEVWVVVHGLADMPLLQSADRVFLIDRRGTEVPGLAQLQAIGSYDDMLTHEPQAAIEALAAP
jgi:glucosyl-3-phosphoglycerate synthase